MWIATGGRHVTGQQRNNEFISLPKWCAVNTHTHTEARTDLDTRIIRWGYQNTQNFRLKWYRGMGTSTCALLMSHRFSLSLLTHVRLTKCKFRKFLVFISVSFIHKPFVVQYDILLQGRVLHLLMKTLHHRCLQFVRGHPQALRHQPYWQMSATTVTVSGFQKHGRSAKNYGKSDVTGNADTKTFINP
jgi:hypothetical protein